MVYGWEAVIPSALDLCEEETVPGLSTLQVTSHCSLSPLWVESHPVPTTPLLPLVLLFPLYGVGKRPKVVQLLAWKSQEEREVGGNPGPLSAFLRMLRDLGAGLTQTSLPRPHSISSTRTPLEP